METDKKVILVYRGLDKLNLDRPCIVVSNSYGRLEGLKEQLQSNGKRTLIFYAKKRACLKGDGLCSGCKKKPRKKRDYAELNKNALRYLEGKLEEDLCPFYLQYFAVKHADFLLTIPALLDFVSRTNGAGKFKTLVIDNSAELFFPFSQKIEENTNYVNSFLYNPRFPDFQFEINTPDDTVLFAKVLLLLSKYKRGRMVSLSLKVNNSKVGSVLEVIQNSLRSCHVGECILVQYWCEDEVYRRYLTKLANQKFCINNCSLNNLISSVLVLARTRIVEAKFLEDLGRLTKETKRAIIKKVAQLDVEEEVIEFSKAMLYPLGILKFQTNKIKLTYLIADEWTPVYKIPELFDKICILTNPLSDKARRLAKLIAEEQDADFEEELVHPGELKIVLVFNLTKNLVQLVRRLKRENFKVAITVPSKRDQVSIAEELDRFGVGLSLIRRTGEEFKSAELVIALPNSELAPDVTIIPNVTSALIKSPFYLSLFLLASNLGLKWIAKWFAWKIKESELDLLVKLVKSKIIIVDRKIASDLVGALEASGYRVLVLSASNVNSLVETVTELIKFGSVGLNFDNFNSSCSSRNNVNNILSLITEEYNKYYTLSTDPFLNISFEPFSDRIEHDPLFAEKRGKLKLSNFETRPSQSSNYKKIARNLASVFGSSKTLSHSSFTKRIKRRFGIKKKAEIDLAIKYLIDTGRLQKFKRGRLTYYRACWDKLEGAN